jgi:hypothetical protein
MCPIANQAINKHHVIAGVQQITPRLYHLAVNPHAAVGADVFHDAHAILVAKEHLSPPQRQMRGKEWDPSAALLNASKGPKSLLL